VVIVSVEVTDDVLLTVTGDGEALQVAPAGAPLQLRVTLPVKPFKGDMVSVEVAVWPAVTVRVLPLVGFVEKLKSGVAATVMVTAPEVEPE
jgi:hypothetical protein